MNGPAVTGVAVCVLCILFILFFANIISPRHVKSEMACVWYLRMLHITSAVMVAVLLTRHIGFPTISLTLCRWLNNVYFAGETLARIWIYLLWENQYRMVSNAMREDSESNLWDPVQLIAKLLVVLPIINLSLNLHYAVTGYLEIGSNQFSCLATTRSWVANTTMCLNLAVDITFTGLFLRHLIIICSTVKNLAESLSGRWDGTELARTADPLCSTARKFAIRRVVVSLVDTLWVILILAVMYRLHANKHDVYTERIMRMLHQLSNNVLQYFVLFKRLKRSFFFTDKRSLEEPLIQVRNVSVHTMMLCESIPAISRLELDYSKCMTISTNDSDPWADVRKVFTACKVSNVSESFLDSDNEV